MTLILLVGLDGEVVPCGCSDGQRGGLIKYASLVRSLREESQGVGFVSLGDNMLSRWISDERYAASAGYYASRAAFMHKTLLSLNPAAYTPSNHERDLYGKFKLGGDWLGQGNSSELTTSGGSESLKVAIEVSPEKPATPPDDANHPDATWLLRFSSSRQPKSTVTHIQMVTHRRVDGRWTLVGNTRLPAAERGGRDLQTLRLYFPIAGIVSGVTDFSEVATILSVSARLDPQSKLLKRYRKRVGKQLAEPVVLYHWQPQRVAMSLPDDPDMLTRFQKFRRQAIFGQPRRELKSGQKYAATCSPCHAEITEYYMKHDHHVKAMDTLRGLNNGSDKDPACTTCHTTPRLITAKDKTKSYDLHEGVLCASCHTDADSHARRPNLVRPLTVQRSLCESCHNSVQSPNYRHEAYWKKLGCVEFKKNR